MELPRLISLCSGVLASEDDAVVDPLFSRDGWNASFTILGGGGADGMDRELQSDDCGRWDKGVDDEDRTGEVVAVLDDDDETFQFPEVEPFELSLWTEGVWCSESVTFHTPELLLISLQLLAADRGLGGTGELLGAAAFGWFC